MKIYTFFKKWRIVLILCGCLIIAYGAYFFTHPAGHRAYNARVNKIAQLKQIAVQLEEEIAHLEYDIENMEKFPWYQEQRARTLHYRYPDEEIWYVE